MAEDTPRTGNDTHTKTADDRAADAQSQAQDHGHDHGDECGCGHDHDHGHGHGHAPLITYKRAGPKTGRNDPCPCGSGKKYKKCCLYRG